MDGPWADYAVPQDAAPVAAPVAAAPVPAAAPVQASPPASPGIEVDIDKGYTAQPDGSIRTLEAPPQAPAEAAPAGPWADYAGTLPASAAPPAPTRSDEGLGFEDGITRPLDNLSGWVDGGLQKIGVPMDAINHTLGFPTQAEQVGAHQKALADAAATGVKPGALGEFAGSVAATLPLAALPGGALLQGALGGGLESERGADAATVAKNAVLGGVLGKASDIGINAVGSMVSPTLTPAVQNLLNAGVKLTPGQVAANKGLIGTAAKLSGAFPVAGELKRAADNQALASFQTAAANDALKPIGVTLPKGVAVGGDTNQAVRSAVSDAYDKVGAGQDVPIDETYAGQLAGIRSKVAGLPGDLQSRFNHFVSREIQGRQDRGIGGFTADGVKDAKAALNAEISKWNPSNGFEADYVSALRDVRATLFSNLGRAVPGADKALANADAAWAGYKTMEGAAKRATGQANVPPGSFTPTHLLQQIKATAPTSQVTDNAAPMQQLANDGVSLLPRSFTAPVSAGHVIPEAIVTAGVGASDLLGGHRALALGIPAAMGLLHLAPNATRAAMTTRPEWAPEVRKLLDAGRAPAAVSTGVLSPQVAALLAGGSPN